MNEKPKYEKSVSDIDQAAEAILRTMPTFLWSFFKALKDQGFTDAQALALTIEQVRCFK